MKHMQPVQACVITSQLMNLPPNLSSCTHVFVWQDSIQPRLQQPYQDPYRVLHRLDKVLTLKLDRNIDNVCIDRLKPADMFDYFNIGVLESNTLRNRPPDGVVATTNSPPSSGLDSSGVSIGVLLPRVPETLLLAMRRGQIIRKPSRFQ